MSDVLLVYPPMKGVELAENLGLSYIASYLRNNGINVLLIDTNLEGWSAKRAVEEISRIPAKVIGVTVPFQMYALEALNFISVLKERVKVHISIGGIFPTFAYREILERFQSVDSIILGEGEVTFYELVRAIFKEEDWRNIYGIAYKEGNDIKVTPMRPSIRNLDSLPFPARDNLKRIYEKTKIASIISSRGCYARCSFCSVVPFYEKLGPRIRLRSPENVLDELEILVREYNVKNIVFCDGNFTVSKERASRIAEEIIKRKLKINYAIESRATEVEEDFFKLLKESGLKRIFLGIESGSQTMLERFKKGITVEQNIKALEVLSKLDLYVSPGFIMFDDRTTLEEIQENIRFLKLARRIMGEKIRPFDITTRMYPLAGTEFETYLKENGKYKGDVFNPSYEIEDFSVRFVYHFLNFSNRIISFLKNFVPQEDWDSRWIKD